MRNAMRIACLSALLLTATTFPSHAKELKNLTSLNVVTVHATRSPQSTFDVPAIVSKVNTDAAGNALASDVSDLLEFTAGVEVNNSPRRIGQTISIRGFDDAATITLMDGRRQNYESGHDGRFFIDPSLLKSIEVVKGASSSIYGGGAIGGVVAFETKEAADLLAPGEMSGALTSFGYRSANNEYAPVITGYGRIGSLDLLGSLSYRDSGDIRQGDGNELNSRDHMLSGLFKGGYTFNDFHTLKFQAQMLNNNGREPSNSAGNVSVFENPIVDKDIKDHQVSLKYAFENPDNNWLNPRLHIYYNDTKVEKKNISPPYSGRIRSRELNTFGFTADNQTKLTVSDRHHHIFSYGFEMYNDDQTGYNSTSPTGVYGAVPNAEATNYGFYLQDEIALNNFTGNFLIIPAVRFDQYESDDEKGHSQNENEISPKFSLSYKPIKNVMLFGSWASAFRAPNLTELYPSGQHFPGNNFVPNPNLKPETVTTIELGAGLDFKHVLAANDRAKIKGSWFTSDGEDFITFDVDVFAGTSRNVNIANATLTGIELEGQYELHPLSAKVGLSYVEAENDDTGEYLSNNVPLTLVMDINYKIDLVNSVIGWRARFAEKNDKVSNRDTPKSGYAVHDLYYRFKTDNKGTASLTVDVGIDNVFDKAYTKRFGSLLEEGRSYVMRASYKW